jgi:hypothetical protein
LHERFRANHKQQGTQHDVRAVRKTVPRGWFAKFFDNRICAPRIALATFA